MKNKNEIKAAQAQAGGHTPGPWEVSDTSIIAAEVCIAVIEDDGGYEAPSEQREANARLIAAAPALLAALKAIEKYASSKMPIAVGYPIFTEARAVLDLAKGGK